jgi:hypothetical protein
MIYNAILGKGKVEEEVKMVKEVVLSPLDMGPLMPLYSKWATSQLQFIKDRSIRDQIVLLSYILQFNSFFRQKSKLGKEYILR